jgi:hypothetical protein
VRIAIGADKVLCLEERIIGVELAKVAALEGT